jgi:hypothetical protein
MKSSQSPEETNTNTAGTPQASAANDDIAIILPDEGIVVEHQHWANHANEMDTTQKDR